MAPPFQETVMNARSFDVDIAVFYGVTAICTVLVLVL